MVLRPFSATTALCWDFCTQTAEHGNFLDLMRDDDENANYADRGP